MRSKGRVSHHGIAVRRRSNRTVQTMAWLAGRFALLCLLIATAAPAAGAQVLASSFDQLSVLVKPGDTVSVTDVTGREVRGTVAALSLSSLELIVAGNRRPFSEGETRTIRQRRPDSFRNGALWGVAIGAGLGLTTLIDTEDSPALSAGEGIAATAVLAGLGAAVGVGLDAIFRSNDVIYSRPAGTSVKLMLSPILTRGRRAGALVSLGF
jgi:hypothetical protein